MPVCRAPGWVGVGVKPTRACFGVRGLLCCVVLPQRGCARHRMTPMFVGSNSFGISRELRDSLSKCRSVVGTVTYMSPERIRAEPYSFQSDIWGLGLTLMECAIGRFPYPPTPYYLELIQFIATEPPPKFPKDREFSKEFKDFIYRCIAKDPSKRPTAEELKKHPWIQQNLKSDFDMKKWIAENELVIKVADIDVHEESRNSIVV